MLGWPGSAPHTRYFRIWIGALCFVFVHHPSPKEWSYIFFIYPQYPPLMSDPLPASQLVKLRQHGTTTLSRWRMGSWRIHLGQWFRPMLKASRKPLGRQLLISNQRLLWMVLTWSDQSVNPCLRGFAMCELHTMASGIITGCCGTMVCSFMQLKEQKLTVWFSE